MSKAIHGKVVADTEVPATGDLIFRLSDFRGQIVVLYFYPKDSTPGCTTEGQDFRDQYNHFRKLKAEVFGVSRDSLKSHENFKAKQSFPFELISDADETLCNQFDVIREKSLYGKKYLGIDRSTFVIDKKGVLRHEFRGVKVDGHVAAVLTEVKKLARG
ncbi:MAG: peroxiredoxin [Gammaproteobacteria bacterium]|nr:peroxiredoxin [Gammaproteobacteria bacterium]